MKGFATADLHGEIGLQPKAEDFGTFITSPSLKVTTCRVLHIHPLICHISTKPTQPTRDGQEGWSSRREELATCSKGQCSFPATPLLQL